MKIKNMFALLTILASLGAAGEMRGDLREFMSQLNISFSLDMSDIFYPEKNTGVQSNAYGGMRYEWPMETLRKMYVRYACVSGLWGAIAGSIQASLQQKKFSSTFSYGTTGIGALVLPIATCASVHPKLGGAKPSTCLSWTRWLPSVGGYILGNWATKKIMGNSKKKVG